MYGCRNFFFSSDKDVYGNVEKSVKYCIELFYFEEEKIYNAFKSSMFLLVRLSLAHRSPSVFSNFKISFFYLKNVNVLTLDLILSCFMFLNPRSECGSVIRIQII